MKACSQFNYAIKSRA